IFTFKRILTSAFEITSLRRTAAAKNHSSCRMALALFCVAIASELAAQTPSNPIQLPASGRVLQSGSVSTTQSTVNAGGQNSVNLIDSSVNIQGSYLGSVPTGTATDAVISLSL